MFAKFPSPAGFKHASTYYNIKVLKFPPLTSLTEMPWQTDPDQTALE